MMPEIVIHIGLHKTGTTAFQAFCSANERIFNHHGVFFPMATRENKRGQIIHSNLSWELLGHDMFDPALGTFDDLLEEIRSRTDVRKWFITGEGLSRLKDPSVLLSRFHPHPVTVIAYFRDPVEAAPSLYTEHLKAGYHFTFDEWIEGKSTRWLDRITLMKPWHFAGLSRTGRVLARLRLKQAARFENPAVKIVQRALDKDSLHGGNLMEDMLHLLSLGHQAAAFEFSPPAFSNPRISAAECIGLLFLNTLHRENEKMTAQQKVKDRLSLRRAIKQAFPHRTQRFGCTPRQQSRLRQLFGNDRPAPPGTPPAAREDADDELLDWLMAFKKDTYATGTLSLARQKAHLFQEQQEYHPHFWLNDIPS